MFRNDQGGSPEALSQSTRAILSSSKDVLLLQRAISQSSTNRESSRRSTSHFRSGSSTSTLFSESSVEREESGNKERGDYIDVSASYEEENDTFDDDKLLWNAKRRLADELMEVKSLLIPLRKAQVERDCVSLVKSLDNIYNESQGVQTILASDVRKSEQILAAAISGLPLLWASVENGTTEEFPLSQFEKSFPSSVLRSIETLSFKEELRNPVHCVQEHHKEHSIVERGKEDGVLYGRCMGLMISAEEQKQEMELSEALARGKIRQQMYAEEAMTDVSQQLLGNNSRVSQTTLSPMTQMSNTASSFGGTPRREEARKHLDFSTPQAEKSRKRTGVLSYSFSPTASTRHQVFNSSSVQTSTCADLSEISSLSRGSNNLAETSSDSVMRSEAPSRDDNLSRDVSFNSSVNRTFGSSSTAISDAVRSRRGSPDPRADPNFVGLPPMHPPPGARTDKQDEGAAQEPSWKRAHLYVQQRRQHALDCAALFSSESNARKNLLELQLVEWQCDIQINQANSFGRVKTMERLLESIEMTIEGEREERRSVTNVEARLFKSIMDRFLEMPVTYQQRAVNHSSLLATPTRTSHTNSELRLGEFSKQINTSPLAVTSPFYRYAMGVNNLTMEVSKNSSQAKGTHQKESTILFGIALTGTRDKEFLSRGEIVRQERLERCQLLSARHGSSELERILMCSP